MGDGINGERDAILYAHFPHELGDVRLDRSLFNAQGSGNFPIRAGRYQKFKHFRFAGGELRPGGHGWTGRAGGTIDEDGQARDGAPRWNPG